MEGIIYCAINKVNQKRYIGQTIQELKERIKKHISTDCCPYFHHAIEKYGIESFEWKIIDKGSSYEELDQKERFWIAFFQSNNSFYGYNLTEGGQNGGNLILTKERLREVRSKWIKKNGSNYKEYQQTRANVLCIETGIVYKSAHEAAKQLKLQYSHICKVARGDTWHKTHGGYHWKYVTDLSFYPRALYCVENDEIYLTINEAKRKGHFGSAGLLKAYNSNGKIFSYAGYTFEKINYE